VREEDLPCHLRSALESLGVSLPPEADLPTALLRAVLERLRVLDTVPVEAEEPLPLLWTEAGPWTPSV
jgi:hypothetical protein